jgi:hypothetical protein
MPTKKTLSTHKAYLGPDTNIKLENLSPGDVVRFTYKKEERIAFIVHPDWEDKVHALTFKELDRKTFINEVTPHFNRHANPQDMYETLLSRNEFVKNSYRTYFRKEITKLRRIEYTLNKRKHEIL